MAKCAATDPTRPKGLGRICYVPSRAKLASVISISDTPVASTNLKCDIGDTEDSLCNRVQLTGVIGLLVFVWVNTPPRIRPRI